MGISRKQASKKQVELKRKKKSSQEIAHKPRAKKQAIRKQREEPKTLPKAAMYVLLQALIFLDDHSTPFSAPF